MSKSTLLKQPFATLLAALVLLMVTAPVIRSLSVGWHPILAPLVFTSTFAAMLVSAVLAVGRSRRTVLFALLLAGPVILLELIRVWLDYSSLELISHMLAIAFLIVVVVTVLRYVFVSAQVNANVICASLCVYLLLGVAWALVYSLTQILDPASFSYALAETGDAGFLRFSAQRSALALYYSFVTMSTLGYGDIIPTSPVARMLAALQAIVGQLYLAVLVARLVGLHIVHATARRKG